MPLSLCKIVLMKTVLWILAVLVAIYLILVIPAGVSVFIAEKKFKTSPLRKDVEEIISIYKAEIENTTKDQIEMIIKRERREVFTKNGIDFSVVISAKRKKNDKYYFIISVGKLKPITIGHAEKFNIEIKK
jgi:hypothetical protein